MPEMSGIQIQGLGYLPLPPGVDAEQANKLVQSGALANLDATQILAELAKLAATVGTSGKGIPGVSGSNGAPSIDGVMFDFSAEDMAAALLVLQGKTQDAQLSTAREGLVTNKKKMEEKNAASMKKINEWIKACEDAAAKEKSGGIMGWFKKIGTFIAAALAVVVAVAATAATGGAAGPLLALAVIGLVGATISLASAISQEAGGPALELSTLTAKLCTVVLEACGVPKDKAEAAGKMMSGMAGLMTGAVLVDPAFAGNAFGGFAELVGADAMQVAIVTGVFTAVATIAIAVAMVVATGGASAPSTIASIAGMVKTGAAIAQGAVGLATGAVGVAQGVNKLEIAKDERTANLAQADKKQIDAIIAKLQKQMEDDREEIKKVLDEIMQGMTIVSQMINSAGQSRSQLASGLLGKGQTI
jgi:hypothetical protein